VGQRTRGARVIAGEVFFMILRTLVPTVIAWLLCAGKHKIMSSPTPPANSLPEPLAHMLDELPTADLLDGAPRHKPTGL